MCIIAAIPAKKIVDKETFLTMWDNNPDGAGLMYAHNGKIIVLKEMFDPYYLYKKYQEVSKLNVNIVLHFRIATSGTVDRYNIHPFKVSDGLFFCHNGILSNVSVPKDSKENDTQIFNNTILKHLPANFIYNKGINKLLTEAIGRGNKFVFLDSKGNIKIINRKAGVKDCGIWFSNASYYSFRSKAKKVKETKNHIDLNECESCGNIATVTYNKEFNSFICSQCEVWVKQDQEQFNYTKKKYLWNDSDLF